MKGEDVRKILNAAIRAPSGNNLQNWKVKIMKGNKGFELSIDLFVEDFFDIDNIAAYFSCGCFLKNVEIAALRYGYRANIKIDTGKDQSRVARVVFSKSSKGDFSLYDEIRKRMTSRVPYDGKELPDEFYEDVSCLSTKYSGLNNIFIKKGSGLFEKSVDVLYKVESIKMFNESSALAISNMIRYPIGDVWVKDGLDYRLLGVSFFPRQLVKLAFNQTVVNFFKKVKLNIVPYVSAKKVLNSSPGVGFIFIKDISLKNVVAAGMFFQELWLTVTKYEGALHPFGALSFFNFKIDKGELVGFKAEEIVKLKYLKEEVFSISKIGKTKKLMIAYSYGFPEKDSRVLSKRKDLNEFLLKDKS